MGYLGHEKDDEFDLISIEEVLEGPVDKIEQATDKALQQYASYSRSLLGETLPITLEKAIENGQAEMLNGPNPKQRYGDKKVALGQVLPVAMAHESLAMMDGDLKYGYRNFRDTKVEAMTYVHAALRHIEAWAEGEELAEDSGVHHLGHARACLGILLDAQENDTLIDNRKKGVFSKVLKRMEDWVEKRKKKYEKTDTNVGSFIPHLCPQDPRYTCPCDDPCCPYCYPG